MISMHEPARTLGYYYRFARHHVNRAWRHFRLATNFYDSGLGDSAWVLYGLVRALKPDVCVEIGSARGKSTCHIARALRENLGGRLYAIDPHQSTAWNDAGEPQTLRALERNLRAVGARGFVEIIRAPSPEVGRSWHRPIDLLFIDGDHSYEGVRLDWELFSPHLTRFGVAIFHDTTWELNDYGFTPRSDLGVARFLEELRIAAFPLITINRNYGVTLVQSCQGGIPLGRASGSCAGYLEPDASARGGKSTS
jgi:predicted O-methyltransferase YrrM